jgi:phosphatidylglycerol---prolipoprotein diacylglyceryl transferase
MSILNYLIWNGSPEIFKIGTFALRWYGLFFALGFLISQQLLYYMYRKEGKPERDVDTLTIYMVIATIIGARLGHIIFYQPEIILENPLGIFLPFEFNPFRFTGLQGLASHGAAIGILFALWLYSRYSITFSKSDADLAAKPGQEGKVVKKVRRGLFIQRRDLPGQSYLQVLDRIVILVALTGALIRLGNFYNSEIIGKPTDASYGVVFVNRLTEAIDNRQEDMGDIVESIVYHQNDSLPKQAGGRIPLSVYVFFKPGVTELDARPLMYFARDMAYRLEDYFDGQQEFNFEIALQKDGNLGARLNVVGIARHPAQLYESISSFLLFVVLFLIWARYKVNLPKGRIFGVFLVVLWSLRFAYEFLKENQEAFEDNLPLNMGQILSIPLIIIGIFILINSFREKNENQK